MSPVSQCALTFTCGHMAAASHLQPRGTFTPACSGPAACLFPRGRKTSTVASRGSRRLVGGSRSESHCQHHGWKCGAQRLEIGFGSCRAVQDARGERRSQGRLSVSAHNKAGVDNDAGQSRRAGGEGDGRRVVFAAASGSSSSGNGMNTTTSVETPPPVTASSSSPYPGSPLLWVGVGVAISVVFIKIAKELEKRSAQIQRAAMQQILKSMTGNQPGAPPSPFGMPGFPMPPNMPSNQPGAMPSPFAIPMPGYPTPPSPPPPSSSTVESTIAAAPASTAAAAPAEQAAAPVSEERKRPAFTDVSLETVVAEEEKQSFFRDAEVVDGSSSGGGPQTGEASSTKQPVFTVDALEKMMEDPMVQKMVYPYLPEEMRNPTTFKWMLQNPQYRQQLQDMLGNMGGDSNWDSRMTDMMNNFNLNSEDVKQQFDQIGMSPEDVISKIMANPDVAVAFQNPKVQAAIMDCSQNPLNISKYQNDREVMDVFSRISELFPGMT